MPGQQPKICYVCYRRFPETNILHLSRIVSSHGFHVTILLFSSVDQHRPSLGDQRTVHVLPLSGVHGTRKHVLSFTVTAARFLNKHRFSIVHIESSCAYFSVLRLLAPNCSRFIYHCLSYPLSHSYYKRLKEQLKVACQSFFMDRIMLQSEATKCHWAGLRASNKVAILPVGFDKDTLYPIPEGLKNDLRRSLGLPNNHFLLVYCGIMSRPRNLTQLLTAFKRVTREIKNVTLLMVGQGPALTELKILASSLGIKEHVVFTGRVPHERVRNHIAMADVGVSYIPITDGYNYNPPLKTFEYLACGLPTIATRTLSNCEIIRDGFNGILCDDTPEGLSRSTISLLRDKRMRIRLKTNARSSILDFDFSKIALSHLIPIYRTLL